MGKPMTIRELLIPPFSQNQATALAERVEAVLKLHFEEGPMDEGTCHECFAPWPCATIRALDGESNG